MSYLICLFVVFRHLLKCKEQWENLRKNCEKFENWLTSMEESTKELDLSKGSILEIKGKLRELEKQATTKTGYVILNFFFMS
jgi:hypothetical protein